MATELTGASYKLRKQVSNQLSSHREAIVAAIGSRDAAAAQTAALAYHHRTADLIMALPRTTAMEPGASPLSSLLASLLRH